MDRLAQRKKARRLKEWAKRVIQDNTEVLQAKEIARKGAFESAATFRRALEGKGYTQIGAGAHSRVYACPKGNKVLKVLHSPESDGWVPYIKWATENGYAGKQAPLVHSYKLVKGRRSKFGLALMERLDRTLSNVKRGEDAYLANELFALADKNTKAKDFLETMLPGLGKFSVDLKTKFKDDLDIHDGNFMVRTDGSFVVADPVAGRHDNSSITRFTFDSFANPSSF